MDAGFTQILIAVVGVLATGGTFLAIKSIQNRNNQNKGRINQVSQKNIQSGGDVAGGDITKK